MENKTGLLQVVLNNPVDTNFVLGYVRNEIEVTACTMCFMGNRTSYTFHIEPVSSDVTEAIKQRLEANRENY